MSEYISVQNLVSSLSVLVPTPEEATLRDGVMDQEDLVSSWHSTSEVENCCKWTLGDIAAEACRSAKAKNPNVADVDALRSFAEETGANFSTMRGYAWVSQAFPARSDRETSLSWSHYRATVATADPHMWIRIAIDEHLSVAALERRIREEAGEELAPEVCCAQCRTMLETDNSLTIYRFGKKEAALCSDECALQYFAFLIENKHQELLNYDGSKDTVLEGDGVLV